MAINIFFKCKRWILINQYIDPNDDIEYKFDDFSTYEDKHDLPFNISINPNQFNNEFSSVDDRKIIYFREKKVEEYTDKISILQFGNSNSYQQGSDQLELTLLDTNVLISEEYLNTLVNEFDLDGINDRKLEHIRTIDFVNNRSKFLKDELESIEGKKQNFKENNNLTDIKSDADLTITQQYNYDSELFDAESQMDLINLFEKELSNESFKLLPADFGLNNQNLNNLVLQYNNVVRDRDRFLRTGAGLKNTFIKNLDNEIISLFDNIQTSIKNYKIT